tara:strand:+ start:1102 stop:3135 length:2034 start_codon:yes stop_codon:yes gene_type:complete
MKIFLGDLVHNYSKSGIWTFPLNIAYVASYAKQNLKNHNTKIEFRLFKDPTKMIEAIKNEKPDIVGLSYYVWNENLNNKVFQISKNTNKDILTVGGGPHFTNHNANQLGARKFFTEQPYCDSFVVNQGEKGFLELIKNYISSDKNLKIFQKSTIKGVMTKKPKSNYGFEINIGEDIGTLDDLNDIPSPYLDGTLDEFFDGPFLPILETNRSCPYRCTFCAWGIGTQKLKKFDDKRVLNEIQYIYERCDKASTLFIADANFGILERDATFAAKIYEGHKKTGFPYHVAVQWNKTRPDRILNVAKAFRSIAPVGASMQSINDEVLSAIKRKNLTFEQVVEMQKQLKSMGIQHRSFSELIIGLPNETKQTHIEANRQLIDHGFEVWNYNLHLLPGTEMDDADYRSKYFKKTGYRLHDNCYGIYDGEKIFEAQETVLKTNGLTIQDFRYFRFFHFLQQMMWSKRWYYNYLKFLKNEGFHPVKVFDLLIKKIKLNKSNLGKVYKNFMKDYDKAEAFKSFEELSNFWSDEKNFNRLEEGEYGKLNMLYTYKIILDHRTEFNNFLIEFTNELPFNKNTNKNRILETVKDLIKFENSRIVKFNNDWSVEKKVNVSFRYDILKWSNEGYNKLNKSKKKKEYKFYLKDKQYKALSNQLSQYKSNNINATLRNMTVYTDSQQFFYSVK